MHGVGVILGLGLGVVWALALGGALVGITVMNKVHSCQYRRLLLYYVRSALFESTLRRCIMSWIRTIRKQTILLGSNWPIFNSTNNRRSVQAF